MASVTDFELQPAMKLIWQIMGPFVRRRLRASGARAKMLIEATAR
jgi:hypothetical protein